VVIGMDDDFDCLPEDSVAASIRRARETIARVDATLAEPRPDPATLWQAPAAPEPRTIAPASKPKPALSREAINGIGAAIAIERKAMREHVEKRMGEFASIIGEETGKVERDLRRQVEELKAELVELRGFVRGVAAAGAASDLPLPKFLRDRDAASH
jgi:hypothetical protein